MLFVKYGFSQDYLASVKRSIVITICRNKRKCNFANAITNSNHRIIPRSAWQKLINVNNIGGLFSGTTCGYHRVTILLRYLWIYNPLHQILRLSRRFRKIISVPFLKVAISGGKVGRPSKPCIYGKSGMSGSTSTVIGCLNTNLF